MIVVFWAVSVPLLTTMAELLQVRLTVPPLKVAVPLVNSKPSLRTPVDVRAPLLTVVVPPTIPPLLMAVVPPVRLAKPMIFATLVTVPPDWVRLAAVPPVRFAFPAFTTKACREALAVRLPEVLTVVVPPTIPPLLTVVFPPVRLAKLVTLATLVTLPAD